jgi:hypothetical protein
LQGTSIKVTTTVAIDMGKVIWLQLLAAPDKARGCILCVFLEEGQWQEVITGNCPDRSVALC